MRFWDANRHRRSSTTSRRARSCISGHCPESADAETGRSGGPGGWSLVPDVDVRFGPHDIYRPDISGWRKQNVPMFPLERPVPHRPDWICEGLSPRTAVIDQGAKRTTYAQTGVPWYWLVEPSNRTISVLRLTNEGYVVDTVVGDHGRVRLAPFEAIEIELDSLFPPPADGE